MLTVRGWRVRMSVYVTHTPLGLEVKNYPIQRVLFWDAGDPRGPGPIILDGCRDDAPTVWVVAITGPPRRAIEDLKHIGELVLGNPDWCAIRITDTQKRRRVERQKAPWRRVCQLAWRDWRGK